LICSKCNKENNSYLTKCKYCGNRFIPIDTTRKELKYCECGCSVPLTNGVGYCVNCKEQVYSFELFY
jgi:hypothetical protein